MCYILKDKAFYSSAFFELIYMNKENIKKDFIKCLAILVFGFFLYEYTQYQLTYVYHGEEMFDKTMEMMKYFLLMQRISFMSVIILAYYLAKKYILSKKYLILLAFLLLDFLLGLVLRFFLILIKFPYYESMLVLVAFFIFLLLFAGLFFIKSLLLRGV